MLTKIVDEIMSAPEHFGEQVVHDFSLLEFENPLKFEELCSSIESIESFIIERCPYSFETIRNRINDLKMMLDDDDEEI